MGIRGKLLYSIVSLTLGYILFLGLIEWTASTTQKHLGIVSSSLSPAAASVQQAQASFQRLTQSYKDAVMLQDASSLNAGDAEAQAGVAALQSASDKLAYDPALQRQAADLVTRFSDIHSRSKAAFTQMIATPSPGTQSAVMTLQEESKKMEQSLKDLYDLVGVQAFQAELDAVTASNSRQVGLGLGLFLVAVLIAIGSVYVMEKQVSKPLRELAERLADGARRVAASALHISTSGQMLAEGASSQAASLEETSASSEEISSMAQRSAADCHSAADLVTMSQVKFTDANKSLSELVSAMNEISVSSGKVSKIIKIIDEIAFQTNILALNAAVEAARAGEAGLGFAVVADEVRNLAQRCAQAARDSAEIVDESIARSKQGKSRLDNVAISIQAVTGESVKVKILVDQINTASNEQTRGITQIAKSISLMEKVTQSSASSAQESSAAAQDLTSESNLLNEIVSSLGVVIGGHAAHV